MNILRIVLSIIAGIVIGSLVNMGIVSISPHIIAPPAGIDTTTQEGLTEAIPFFQPKHFIFPFLAHAIGTFAGALIAARVCKTRKLMAALIVSGFFLIGGIINVILLPSPVWFTAVDLIFAYFPMGLLAAKISGKSSLSYSSK